VAPRIRTKEKLRSRRGVVPAAEGFYPGEVATLLGLNGVDYAQLRRLHKLVTPETAQIQGRAWLRFTETEILAGRVALELLGGLESLRPRHRLRWRALERACRVLRERYGMKNPMLEVRLQRRGGTIWALHKGITFEALSGELVFPELDQSFKDYGKLVPLVGPRKGARVVKEMAKIGLPRSVRVAHGVGWAIVDDDSERKL